MEIYAAPRSADVSVASAGSAAIIAHNGRREFALEVLKAELGRQ